MAITNAQQARQLYNEGGPMKKIKGQDHMLAYITPNEADKLVKLGGQETMTPEGILAYPEFDNYTEVGGGSRSDFEGGAYSGTGNAGDGVIQQYNTPKAPPKAPPKKPKKTKDNYKKSSQFTTPTLAAINFFGNKLKNSRFGQFLNTKAREDYLESLKETDPELYQETVDDLSKLGYATRDVEIYGPEGKRDGLMAPGRDIEKFEDLYEDQAKSILNTVRDNKDGGVGTLYDDYLDEKMNRFTPDNDGGNQDPCKGPNPPAYCFIGQSADETQEDVITRNLAGLTPRIGGSMFDFTGMADGGLADMDREAFLLGGIAKGLKKAVRGVKKIAKSPLGKAALIGAGFGLAGMGPFKGLANTSFGQGLAGLRGTLLGQAGSKVGEAFVPYKEGLLTKLGLTKGGGSFMPTFKGGITLASILPLLVGKTEEEKDDILKDYYASQQLTPSTTKRQMGSEFDFYNYNLAEGGMPSKEPVAKKVMPLLDMDGMEKDYRAEGGFVPLGRMEKADDVPARLSKNEFVFTADAVRNAGEGNVDKGAEVMYNMMKNLESGGEVSEESQGLDGAREMFQTSQRLGEVI